MSDPHLGKLTYLRIYSGVARDRHLGARTAPRAARSGSARSTRCTRTSVKSVRRSGAGMIVAVMGLKDTTTGDTLCDTANPVVLESMTFPAPVIHVAIEPKTKSDQEKLGTAIQRLSEEDPTFQVRTDEETGQTDHRRHGRAPPRRPRRPHAPRVQRRGQRRQAAGRLPRDDPQGGREGRVHPQEADRWLRPVRQGHHRHRALRGRRRRRWRRLRVRQQGHRWPHPARVHPVGRRRLPGGHGVRRRSPATRWSTSR